MRLPQRSRSWSSRPIGWCRRSTRPPSSSAKGASLCARKQNSFSQIFASARVIDHASVYTGCSYWWTAGGEGFPAIALARRRMPDPHVFTGMLTGDFGYLER